MFTELLDGMVRDFRKPDIAQRIAERRNQALGRA